MQAGSVAVSRGGAQAASLVQFPGDRPHVLDRLSGVRKHGDQWLARCPAHEDKSPSLSVSRGDNGGVLLHCHAGCQTDAIVQALGLTLADLMPPRDPVGRATVTATYTYRDEHGTHLFDVLRYSNKKFSQRRADGAWTLAGVRRVLYHLDALHRDRPACVLIAEGEKDADRVTALGLPATTSPAGAGNWREDYTQQLIACGVQRVVIVPDNDDAGRLHARHVAQSCHAHGLSVRVLELPDLPVKGDISDWCNRPGNDRQALEVLVTDAPVWTPATDTATDTPPPPVSAVAFELSALVQTAFAPRATVLARNGEPILRAGDLAQVYAPRGVGKSYFVQTLALVKAAGAAALGFSCEQPGRVLVVDGEMHRDDLRQRFIDLARVLEVDVHGVPLTIVAADWQDDYLRRLDTPEGQAAIEPYVDGAELVVLDNRSCLLSPDGEKDASAWQPAQDYLLSLRRRGKAVIVVHHAGRAGQAARGHSKAEDVLNLSVRLSRPDDYSADQGARFRIEFDKARGVTGSAAAPFTAHLKADGWHTSGDDGGTKAKLLSTVRAHYHAGDPLKSATQAVRAAGVNKQAGLTVWADLLKSGELVHCVLDGGVKGFRA